MKLKLLFFFITYSLFGQIPEYYSTIDFSQSGENLKNQLATLITTTHTTELVYTSGSSGYLDTWTVLKQSDIDLENLSYVLLIYGWENQSNTVSEHRSRDVDESCHTSSCTGKWVREHVFPRSLGNPNLGSQGAGADAHNLRAVDSQRNNSRGNKLFADADSNVASYSINTSSWYPGDEWIGDVARIIMYMYLRYPEQCEAINVAAGNATFAPMGDMPDILLQWNAQDPPSEFELNRNNVIAQNQGNRNPFIDNPYLAALIWTGQEAFDSWDLLNISKFNSLEINLYPTVTNGLVYIETSTATKLKYSIYNTLGQLLQENNIEKEIDLSPYSKGLYFIQISTPDNNQTFKVFKN